MPQSMSTPGWISQSGAQTHLYPKFTLIINLALFLTHTPIKKGKPLATGAFLGTCVR